jgi:GGDEF domain-containing protein
MITDLPGGRDIERVMHERLESGAPLAVLHIDLANFEVYTGEYGWLKGERIIRLLANTLIEALDARGGKEDFVGHIYGDDFVVISVPDRAGEIAQEIIHRFDAAIPRHYSEEVRDHRYIDGFDRRGNPVRALMASVAIAIVTNERRELEHPLQIAQLAEEVKKYIKLWPGSNYVFDHRGK